MSRLAVPDIRKNLFDVTDKVVAITGAGQGIGRQASHALDRTPVAAHPFNPGALQCLDARANIAVAHTVRR